MVMTDMINQGDILKIERTNRPALVVSKNFFNNSGEIIACPIYDTGTESALHQPILSENKRVSGIVHCEKLALLNLTTRGYKKLDHVKIDDTINIADCIQAIFDYV